jgi:hypothetical protein
MAHKPTPEQAAIIAAATTRRESLMVTAYAGCAKTSTLEMIAQALPPGPALALAFNVKIKKELEIRFPKHFRIMTLNGLGHSAWQRAIGRTLVVEDRKLGKLVTQTCKEQGFRATTEQWSALRQLVSGAMQVGLVPKEFSDAQGLVPDHVDVWQDVAADAGLYLNASAERMFDLARRVLVQSIKLAYAGTISFDDQIYMSTMFGGEFPRFGLVMVDESQDLSPLNHLQVARTAADRLIVVGDPKQAIYQFRGADSASMSKLRALRLAWIDLPLATTFRCPKLIVQRQRDHAPGFVAWETNPEGVFAILPDTRMLKRLANGEIECKWQWKHTREFADEHMPLAILCRNNAPLLAMAFRLLAQGIPVVMLGRDIGRGLVALATKIAPGDDVPAGNVLAAINEWRSGEISRALANDKGDSTIDSINDRADCLCAVLGNPGVTTAGGLRRALTALFDNQNGRVTLSTGHRAKGLEWDTVLHLDPWRIPAKWARLDPVQMEQEKNLKYVIETRAKRVLIEANLDDFEA